MQWKHLSRSSLVLAWASVGIGYALQATRALTYDEAVYADLASHPWASSYYPEPVFLRHPPLYFLVLALWQPVAGNQEFMLRAPSLVFALVGVWFTWAAVARQGNHRAAAVAGVLLALSLPLLLYGVQVTMYAMAFATMAWGLWAHANERTGQERAALVCLSLTHLFGFVVLGVWAWRHRHAWKAEWPVLVPAGAWVVAAIVVGVAGVMFSPAPAGPALGVGWQLLRYAQLLFPDAEGFRAVPTHAMVFLLSALLLNPILLRGAWKDRKRWAAWGAASTILFLLLFPGPSFLRYALILVPAALVFGLPYLARRAQFRGHAAAAILVAAVGAGVVGGFLASGVDARSINDVPGRLEWSEIATWANEVEIDIVASPAPPALAHYLVQDHGYVVTDASDGPSRIDVASPDYQQIRLVGLSSPVVLLPRLETADAVLVPQAWYPLEVTTAATDCGLLAGARILTLQSCPVEP